MRFLKGWGEIQKTKELINNYNTKEQDLQLTTFKIYTLNKIMICAIATTEKHIKTTLSVFFAIFVTKIG